MRSPSKAAHVSLALLLVSSLSLVSARPAQALPQHNVPAAVPAATDRGRVDPSNELNLTVVLKLHNQAEFDSAVEALYDPASPTYHQWFTERDFARFAPTQAEFTAVSNELKGHGLTMVSSDPDRYWLRVHGTVGQAESAFQTEIHSLEYQGVNFQAHTLDAQLTGQAGALVDAVSGLERHQAHPQIVFAKNFRTGQARFKKPLNTVDASGGLLSQITGTPLSAATLFTFPTPGASLPLAVYYGTVYDSNSKLTVSYTPQQLQAHYGLTSLIKNGYNGKGQTIALVEGYGYADAESDANAAAKIFDLPALNSSNFSVVYPEGKPVDPNAADLTGWTGEIALDIQSSHSIAPGAKILVVASAGQDNEDQIASLQYIISNKLANTVSSSWENDSEILAGPAEENAFNAVLQKGAAAGISFQFSTGDGGDQGLGTPVGDVSLPSNSPYATAVGGTTILNDPAGSDQIVAGWGNNAVYLDSYGPFDPPLQVGFLGGAGGGESVFFTKPSWQKSLPGKGRQVPDVSALADPYTGFAIVYTVQGTQYAQAGIGGTSLASPIFTAIWAIADQYNGKPLGFAAPAISRLKTGQITDVLATSSLNVSDPSGTVYDSSGATFYSATGLFTGLLYTQTEFPSAVWPLDANDYVALSFGTDSSLTVTKGWDNVTGFGEPNGLPFIQGVTGKTTGAALAEK
jgi:subtilase family serine protease